MLEKQFHFTIAVEEHFFYRFDFKIKEKYHCSNDICQNTSLLGNLTDKVSFTEQYHASNNSDVTQISAEGKIKRNNIYFPEYANHRGRDSYFLVYTFRTWRRTACVYHVTWGSWHTSALGNLESCQTLGYKLICAIVWLKWHFWKPIGPWAWKTFCPAFSVLGNKLHPPWPSLNSKGQSTNSS